jgi:hypothetical protein
MTRQSLSAFLLMLLLGISFGAQADEQSDDPGIESSKERSADSDSKVARIVGRWFADQPLREGGRRLSLCERFEDGTFAVTFRLVKADGVVENSTEVGEWGASGPVYFTITKGWISEGRFVPASGGAYFNDAYEILQLEAEVFHYRSYETNDVFRQKRVGAEFRMPDGTGSQ